MKKNISYGSMLAAGMVLLLAGSCCVLEDRSQCPSLVRILSTERIPEGIGGELITKVGTPSQSVTSLSFPMEEYYRDDVHFVLEREQDYTLLGFAGIRTMDALTDYLQIPDWTPCDSLYIVRSDFRIPAGAELLTLTPNSTKEHAVLRFTVTNYFEGYPYNFVLESAADGFRLSDGEPHYATHHSIPERIGDTAEFFTVVARQKEGPLLLRIYDAGKYVGTIDLTSVLLSVDYNWDALNLDDIVFDINFLAQGVEVIINGWTVGFQLDKIIL